MHLEFSGDVWYWRGPAPYHFVTVPEPESARIREVSGLVSYGWGCIQVSGRVGGSSFTTALFPNKVTGLYAVPLKEAVRRAEDLDVGDPVRVRLTIDVR